MKDSVEFPSVTPPKGLSWNVLSAESVHISRTTVGAPRSKTQGHDVK